MAKNNNAELLAKILSKNKIDKQVAKLDESQILKLEKWRILIYNNKEIENYRINEHGDIIAISREITNKIGVKQTVPMHYMKPRKTPVNPHYFIDATIDVNGERKKKSIYVHKALYETFVGKITKDYISFKDGNHKHIVISNLYQVSHSELQKRNMEQNPNARFRLAKHNHKSGYYTNPRKNKSLNHIMVEDIRFLVDEGKKPKEIADILSISLSSVYKYK